MTHTKISFATCKLLNLNRPGLPIYRDTDGRDQDAYLRKAAWRGWIIKDMPSDVWGTQELWHHKALEDVFQSAGFLHNYELLAPAGYEGGEIDYALAVRMDLLVEEAEWIVDFAY